MVREMSNFLPAGSRRRMLASVAQNPPCQDSAGQVHDRSGPEDIREEVASLGHADHSHGQSVSRSGGEKSERPSSLPMGEDKTWSHPIERD